MTNTESNGQADLRREEEARVCDHPDCDESGVHRAPRSPDDLDHYYWFCLEHVRSYNATWNYFIDMSQSEIEDYQKANFTWHRPTWKLGGGRPVNNQSRFDAAWRRGDVKHPYRIFENDENGANDPGLRHMPAVERDALATLNLSSTATDVEIKARYKDLVKRLHPDVNGDDEKALGQLKTVIEAYRTLTKRSSG